MAKRKGRVFRRWRAAHLRLGRRGERVACELLKVHGLELIDRNYAGPHGELDIVARDGVMVCFVEVKTRRQRPGKPLTERPARAVGRAKQRRIIQTARRYLRQLGFPKVAYRYDVVEVIYEGRRLIEARYWPHTFTSGDLYKSSPND